MVSNAAKKLDEVLNTWRERPLGKIEYLVVDARTRIGDWEVDLVIGKGHKGGFACLTSMSCVPDVSSVSRLSNVLSSFCVLCS
jgi:IS30 family transposase